MAEKRVVDCRGLACPQPVIATRAALAASAAAVVVIVDTEGSAINVRRFAESQGARVRVDERAGEYHLTIEPGGSAPSAVERQEACRSASGGAAAVYVASEGMGRGDERLGGVLMAAFLDTLSQFKGKVSHAIFVNAGARLAVEGSPVVDQLRQLEQLGVEVLVCGTCLNHFGLTDRLAVGQVSNMYAIIETLMKAGRIIRP